MDSEHGFSSEPQLGGPNRAGLTRRLLGRATKYRKLIGIALLMSFVAGLTQGLPILLPKLVIDHVLVDEPPATDSLTGLDRVVAQSARHLASALGSPDLDGRLAVVWLTVVLIAVTTLVTATARFLNEYLAKHLATCVVRDLRYDLLACLVRFPLSRLTGAKIGDLVSRFSNDVQTTFLTINVFVSEILLQPFILCGALAGAFVISWQLALCALVTFPIVFLPVLVLGKVAHRRSKKTLHSLGEATESLSQVLGGLRVVKAYQMEEAELESFARVNDRWARRQSSLVRTKARSKAFMDLVYGLVLAAVVGAGSWLVVTGEWGLTAGDLVAFLTALAVMFRPIRRLSVAYNTWQTSIAAAGRVFEVLDTPLEEPDASHAVSIGPIRDGVRFEHVGFAYEDEATGDSIPVLEDVTFELPAGKTVALVGPSGAGKSTVADLLFRFYEPTSGTIRVDGLPLGTVSRQSLLAQVAVVSQQPFLFNTTIRDNIAYGRVGADQEAIEQAARAANIHEEILALPGGYDTLVGERGARLSGGQLQRITIARAILKDASLLLLDEATSNLDTHSERIVQAALRNLMRGRTALVIAHRLSTIVSADRILVLEKGRIVESGSHEQLLLRKGVYQRLYSVQAGS